MWSGVLQENQDKWGLLKEILLCSCKVKIWWGGSSGEKAWTKILALGIFDLGPVACPL